MSKALQFTLPECACRLTYASHVTSRIRIEDSHCMKPLLNAMRFEEASRSAYPREEEWHMLVGKHSLIVCTVALL